MKPFKYNPNQNSGSFRHWITFLKPLYAKDNIGQEEIVDWIPYKSMWAMIRTVKGSEYFSAAFEKAEITSRFIIRYTSGLSANMRIDYQGRIFDIVEPPINDDEAESTLTIIAKECV